jgi:pantoate--beta-alanine ligase
MIIFKLASQLQQYIHQQKTNGINVGFVPTMGALHQGHISLIKQSKSTCNITVCSIFVNPTQFNDVKDFKKYPITIEQDVYLLEMAKCDVLFLPSVDEIYPPGFNKNKQYNLGCIETVFEGDFRPGHFNGVCLVVERLLNVVNPNTLFLGQKDYQQCIVLKKLVDLMNINIDVVVCPISREETGLAMSSRNRRLSDEAKDKAKIVHKYFVEIKQQINVSNSVELIASKKESLLKYGFTSIDYFSLANAETLEPIELWNGTTPIVILAAAFIEGVRLIDNMVLRN